MPFRWTWKGCAHPEVNARTIELPDATPSSDGGMSAVDKARLDELYAVHGGGPVTTPQAVDVVDRPGRLLGVLSAGAAVIGKVGLDAANLAGIALDGTLQAIRDRLPAALASGRLDVHLGGATAPIAVSNFPASQAVSGTVSVANFPASQPVSGAVSILNFPAVVLADVSDRAARLVGQVTAGIGGALDVALSTRAADATLTGGAQKTQVTNFPASQAVSGAVDVVDRVARLLGHVVVDRGPAAANATRIAANATTAVKASPGVLWSIVVNKPGTGTSATTVQFGAQIVGVLDTSKILPGTTISYGVAFPSLTIVTAGGSAPDLTVVWD